MRENKPTVTVRLTSEEMDMLKEISLQTFTTRCNVLRRALHLLYEVEREKKNGGKLNARS